MAPKPPLLTTKQTAGKVGSPSFVVARPVSSGFQNEHNVSAAHVGTVSVLLLSALMSSLFVAGLGHRGLMTSAYPENGLDPKQETEPCNSGHGRTASCQNGTVRDQAGLAPLRDSIEDSSMSLHRRKKLGSTLDYLIPITVLENSGNKAGVCLDGSPPAYHISRGFETGAAKWVVYLEGGGWCTTAKNCRHRARTRLGSSRRMEKELPFGGILSNDSSRNPLFFNWNRVFVRYCDGSSFAGRPQDGLGRVPVLDGQRLFERVMAHLLEVEGLKDATHALLAGCSAGGLAALLHCDQFSNIIRTRAVTPKSGAAQVLNNSFVAKGGPVHHRRLGTRKSGLAPSSASRIRPTVRDALPISGPDGGIPEGTSDKVQRLRLEPLGTGSDDVGSSSDFSPVVKCLSDGGFFPDLSDVLGHRTLWKLFASVVQLHGAVMDPECLGGSEPEGNPKCFMAENFLPFVKTPFFVLNSLYDLWLIRRALIPEIRPEKPAAWGPCWKDLGKCTPEELGRFHEYRDQVIEKIRMVLQPGSGEAEASGRAVKPQNGAFLDSCRTHCQASNSNRWHGPQAPRLHNRTMAEAVSAWFMEEGGQILDVDCQYPCNPTCYPHATTY